MSKSTRHNLQTVLLALLLCILATWVLLYASVAFVILGWPTLDSTFRTYMVLVALPWVWVAIKEY